jgi:hypothetical protein
MGLNHGSSIRRKTAAFGKASSFVAVLARVKPFDGEGYDCPVGQIGQDKACRMHLCKGCLINGWKILGEYGFYVYFRVIFGERRRELNS